MNIDKKTIVCSSIGTILEWFDFTLYIYITPILSKLFFPDANKYTAIIGAFGIFATGYFARPIGGIIFGIIGDKFGRRRALLAAMLLMTFGMIFTAVLPTYATYGIYATLLLIVARVLQGFSMGGEYIGVLVMLIEQSPNKNRGLITALGPFVNGIGVMFSSLCIAILSSHYTHSEMLKFGWRLPYILGFLFGLIFLLVQSMMKESPLFHDLKVQKRLSKSPFWEVLKNSPRAIITGIFLSGYVGVSYYILVAFVPTYLVTFFHMKMQDVMYISSIAAVVYSIWAPLAGWLSDKAGRKTMLFISAILAIILVKPLFSVFSVENFYIVLISQIILTIIAVSFEATFDSTINELFPTKDRYTGMAISYNLGMSICGGIAPMICMFLITVTGDNMFPAYFIIACAVIVAIVVATMKETAFSKLSH